MKLDWCNLYGLSSTVVTDEKARQSDSCRADIMSDSLKEEIPQIRISKARLNRYRMFVADSL